MVLEGSNHIQSVRKITRRVSQKKRHISFENQYFFSQRNRPNRAVPLVVEFLKNIEFQRSYNTFSETHDHFFLPETHLF